VGSREPEERTELRQATGALASQDGHEHYLRKARVRETPPELRADAGAHGNLGGNLPEADGGGAGQALPARSAGLDPERVIAAHSSPGDHGADVAPGAELCPGRAVFGAPTGSQQAIFHPLAQLGVEPPPATPVPSSARVSSATWASTPRVSSSRAVDQAIQTLGGNGLAAECGLAAQLGSRLARIAPVSREMVLDAAAEHTPGRGESY
jgi:alkylation response protein AidB-like acyl-CoA dehydrogenase